jgi:hypothetical protein
MQHYFMIEAKPKPDHPEADESGGSYVSCWINFVLPEGAELLARYYLEQYGWTPGKLHEHKIVDETSYTGEYADSLQYYQEAQADGASFVFHSWSVDAPDADEDFD